MSFRGCLVVQRSGHWSIVVGSQTEVIAGDCLPEELATCVDLMIKLEGLKSPACVLALHSNSCFFANFRVDDAVDLRDRQALAYALEDHLPIDAESTVADFQVIPAKVPGDRSVCAVAIEVERWRPLAEALESLGIAVRSIVPTAILVMQSLAQELDSSRCIDYLLVDEGHCDWITSRGKTILNWKHLPLDKKTLHRHKLLDRQASEGVVVVGADPDQQSLVSEVCGELEVVSDSMASHELRGAEFALQNRSENRCDLRRDQLGPADRWRPIRKHLAIASLAAIVFLSTIIASSWYRANRVEAEILAVQSQQRDRFASAMPDARVPASLLRRVRSEHAAVMKSRLGVTGVEVPVSAPDVLRRLVAALPADIRFRVKQIDIVNGQVNLELEVRSPVDAGVLATSLSSEGFRVKPPVTSKKDERTFDSSLEAEWSGSTQTTLSIEDQISIRVVVHREVSG